MAISPVLLGRVAKPAAPILTYSPSNPGHFTISNWASNITYTVSGGTQTGSDFAVTSVGTPATITAKFAGGLQSTASTALTLAHQWYATGVASTIPEDEGCGPRGDTCCPSGYLNVSTGQTCGVGPGTQQPSLCGGGCPDDCYYRGAIDCYNRALTDYSGSGYTLTGSVWGKAVNA